MNEENISLKLPQSMRFTEKKTPIVFIKKTSLRIYKFNENPPDYILTKKWL